MLTIQKTGKDTDICIPNVLPCRIHHTGPTKVTKRYWAPTENKDGTQTAYFRGRKLRGRAVKLPANYQGMILRSTDKILPQQTTNRPPMPLYDNEDDESDQDAPEPPEQVKILEQISTFNELFVWGHDQLPVSEDAFVKNVEEWISFAEAIHGNPTSTQTTSTAENSTNTST